MYASAQVFDFAHRGQLLAPSIRCICEIEGHDDADTGEALRLILEFHFNDYGTTGRGIENFEFPYKAISFTCHTATSSGLDRIRHAEPELQRTEQEMVEALESLIAPNGPVEVQFRLPELKLGVKDIRGKDIDWRDLKRLKEIRSRLLGGSKPVLPSIDKAEYFAYGDENEGIDIVHPPDDGPPAWRIAGPVPGDLLDRYRELPFVPMASDDVFATKKEALVELYHSALGADLESRCALQLWSQPLHKANLFKCGDALYFAISSFEKFRILGSNEEYGN